MLPDRNFILLETPIWNADLANFVGRVVTSPIRPLEEFAPFPSDQETPHCTADILPRLLPEPRIVLELKELLEVRSGRGAGANLSAVLSANFSRNGSQSRLVECDQLKTYSIENPAFWFNKLLCNQLYKKDVAEILRKNWPKRCYFIYGFLTTTNSKWRIEHTLGGSGALKMSLPLTEITGVPTGAAFGLLDVGGQADASGITRSAREMRVPEEEIIAVSYYVVKLRRDIKFSWNPIETTPVLHRARRAKNNELAMGGEGGDSEDDKVEYDSETDDDDNPAVHSGNYTGDLDRDMEILSLCPTSEEGKEWPYISLQ